MPLEEFHPSALSACSQALGYSAALAARLTQTCHPHGSGAGPPEGHWTHLLHRLTDFSWCSESVFV